MAKKELVDYVEKGLKKGHHVKHIKRHLAKHGHDVSDIEEAVRHVLLTKPYLKRYRHRMFAGIFLTAAVVILIFFIFTYEEGEKVIEYKENLTYSGKTDIELIKLAAAADDVNICKYMQNEIFYYSCLDSIWKRGDCTYEHLIQEGIEECNLRLKLGPLFDEYCVPFTEANDCYDAIAQGKKDVSLCDDRLGCRFRYALEFDDPSACEGIPVRGDDCIQRIALKTKNRSLCSELVDTHPCEYPLMSADEKAEMFNDFYNEHAPDGQLSNDDFEELLKNIANYRSEGMCSKLIGEFRGHSMPDLCQFYRVERTFIKATKGEEDERIPFDAEAGAKICPLIAEDFLRDCCVTIVNERLIKPNCDVYGDVENERKSALA